MENDIAQLATQKQSLDYLLYINPVNFAEEKERFFTALKTGSEYHPQYTYQATQSLFEEEETWLTNAARRHTAEVGAESAMINWEIADQQKRLHFIRSIGSEKVCAAAQDLFGGIDEVTKREAETVAKRVDSMFPGEHSARFDQATLLQRCEAFFSEHGFNEWQAEINIPGAPSVCRVNERKVLFQDQPHYSEAMTEILLAHEVLGHAQQEEAARQQDNPLFLSGFGLYEVLHEGFALQQESKVNERLLLRIALYYLAVAKAEESSLYDTYHYIRAWLPESEAYVLASRVKRGLVDTEMPGTWYKDKVYLEGYLAMQHLSVEDQALVARAKFDVRQLDVVRQLES